MHSFMHLVSFTIAAEVLGADQNKGGRISVLRYPGPGSVWVYSS